MQKKIVQTFLGALLILAASADVIEHQKNDETLTSQRVRRSDDAQPLESVVMQLSQELTQTKAQLTALQASLEQQKSLTTAQFDALKARASELESPVCFSVRFARADVINLGLHQPVPFDVVMYSAGGGYDTSTGTFTVPKSGSYVFSLSMQRHGSDEDTIQLAIMKGTTALGVAEAGYSPFEHGTMVVTAHVQKGDIISVQPLHGTTVYGGLPTVFSGFRISPS